jgi:hypothetical protein
VKIDPRFVTMRVRLAALARVHCLPAFCLLVLVALERNSSAIPQTFSQPNQITLRTGKPTEEFFRDPAVWTPGAEIPGEPSKTAGQDDSTLNQPGPVFGVNASALKLIRTSSGALQQTVVAYDAKTAGATPQKLHDLLAANIAAFAGVHGVTAKGTIRFVTRELVITLPHEASASLEVRITRADASPPARTAAQH